MRDLLLLLFGVLLFVTGNAQDHQTMTVTGVVADSAGLPLANANVVNLSNKRGTITDNDGKFSIVLTGSSGKLEISQVGFISQRVNVTSGTPVLIRLQPSKQNTLDNVIVIGMQQQSRKTATTAVSTVLAADIENRPAPSVDQLLQGRVPGLNVQITSGEPGIAPSVVIRGNSKVSTGIGNDPTIGQARALSGPLYVIDGIPINADEIADNIGATGTNFLAGINVNDIESVEVQKDAAATAAWGSRGANGVIYIKTKRGRSAKPEFRVNIYGGVVSQPPLLKTAVGAAERQAKIDIIDQYATADQRNDLPQILTDRYNPAFNNATDWQGLFYRNGIIKNVDATISAATELLNYRLSANYYDESGIIKSFGFQRYGFRGNFDFRISKKLNAQFIVGMSKAVRERGKKYNNSDDNTPVSGTQQPSSLYGLTGFDSASYLGLSDKLRNSNYDDYYSGAVTINYSILPSLRYTMMASANITSSNHDYFQPSNIDAVSVDANPIDNATPSYASSQKGVDNQYFVSNALNWSKRFTTKGDNNHNILFTAGQQFSSEVANSNFVGAYNIPSNDIQVVPAYSLRPSDYDPQTGSNYKGNAILSFLGQLQYDYNQKYSIYGSIRGDASSRFGKNSKWGYFPAVGAGWVVSEEPFMQQFKDIVSFFKIRGSYGVTGDNAPDYYAPYNSYVISGSYNGATAIRPDYNNGFTKDNFTWSQVIQKNLGIDLYLFKNRVNLTVDLYDKLTKDGFYDFVLPFYTGLGSINFNAKDLWVSNKGLEFQVSVKPLSPTSKFQWNTQFNFAYNKNQFARLPNDNRNLVIGDYYGFNRFYSVGQPVYEYYLINYQGIFNHANEIPFSPLTGQNLYYWDRNHAVVAGDPKWQDINGNGTVWVEDDQPAGDPNPKFTGGWSNDFTYKNFSLSILSIFTWKRDVINTYFQQQISQLTGGYSSSIYSFANSRLPDLSGLNYWTPQKAADPNYKANFPSINPLVGGYYQYIPLSSMFNEDGSYFKIKNVTLGYQVQKKFVDRLGLKGARIYTMVDNVLTLKNSTMPNPELVDQLGVYTGGAYPTPVKFTFGVDVQF